MTVVVKPGFAPVEQYNKVNTQGPWTDIYALGAMMYMMLTGIKPDESTNRAIEDTVQPPHVLDSEIPEYLSNVVMKAMAMNPVLRFQSIGDMEKALLQQKKVHSPEVDQKRRKCRRFVTIVGCGVVVCTAASVLGVRFWNQYLPAASVTVCYQKTGVSTLDAAKQDAMESVAEQFQEFYPQIEVEVTGKSVVEIQEMLEHREENAAVPILFESTDLSEEFCADCVDLTGKLDADMHFFLEHPEEVLARERIMKAVWDTDDLLESRTIDMHVRTLRQKLGHAGDAICTVRKVGYKLSAKGTEAGEDA